MSDLRFYLSLLLQRLHYVLFFLVLGTVIGVSLATLLPSVYRAEAQLVVESEQIPGSLAASTVETKAVEQLQIIERRILTRSNLLDMADRLNVYDGAQAQAEALRPDEIVSDMRRRIAIRTIGGAGRRGEVRATLVNVSFSAPNPTLAAAVVNEVVTLITQEDVRMRTGVSGETLEFFEQEVERLNQELADWSARIVAFQRDNQDALPDDLAFRRAQLTNMQERLLQLDREAATLREQRDNLRRIYEATGRIGAIPGTADAPPATTEERELIRLRSEYAANSAVLSDENPRMRLLRNRIANLEAAVAAQQSAALANDNPGEDQAEAAPIDPYDIQMANFERQLDLIAQTREGIVDEIETLQASIVATPANTIALDALRRDQQNVRQQYDRAVASRARAETGDMIEALSKGERITVVEQATPPAQPVSPDRGRLVAAGVGGGLLAGIGLVVLLELLNASVRRPVEISRKLEIMPIGTVPYIRTRSEIFRRRSKIASAFLVVLIAIPAGLWAVDTYYMPIDLLAERILDRLPIDRLRATLSSSGLGGA